MTRVSKEFFKRLRLFAVVIFTAAALVTTGYGIYKATRSSLFLIRIVEIVDLPEGAPVDAKTVSYLAAIPIGQVNLFDLEFAPVESRILAHPWIKEVTINKRFPQTVSIAVKLRNPIAILQQENSKVAYVDTDGKIFGKVSLKNGTDVPLLLGFSKDLERRLVALRFLESWDRGMVSSSVQLSSLSYDPARGYRATITYPLLRSAEQARAFLDLGQEIEQDTETNLIRVGRVLRYLSENNVSARQIWADAGKKIVVKIARRS